MHWQESEREQQGRAQEEGVLQEEQREAGGAAALWKGRCLRLLFAPVEGLVRPALTDKQLIVTLFTGEPKEQLVFPENQGAGGEPTSTQF